VKSTAPTASRRGDAGEAAGPVRSRIEVVVKKNCNDFFLMKTNIYVYDTRARGGQGADASDQPFASAATQTRPRFGPGLRRSGRRGHPF
jgi:hypothetical protein